MRNVVALPHHSQGRPLQSRCADLPDTTTGLRQRHELPGRVALDVPHGLASRSLRWRSEESWCSGMFQARLPDAQVMLVAELRQLFQIEFLCVPFLHAKLLGIWLGRMLDDDGNRGSSKSLKFNF